MLASVPSNLFYAFSCTDLFAIMYVTTREVTLCVTVLSPLFPVCSGAGPALHVPVLPGAGLSLRLLPQGTRRLQLRSPLRRVSAPRVAALAHSETCTSSQQGKTKVAHSRRSALCAVKWVCPRGRRARS